MISFLMGLLIAVAPATQPTTQADDDVAHLKEMVAAMQQHIAQLEAENTALKKKLMATSAIIGKQQKLQKPAYSDPIAMARNIKDGMSRDQAVVFMQRVPDAETPDQSGDTILTWYYYRIDDAGGSVYLSTSDYAEATSVAKIDKRISVYLKDSKVDRVTVDNGKQE